MNVDDAFQLLRHARIGGRLAHAYVVEGPVATDGTALAVKTLSLLFCGARAAPCGTCVACRQVAARTYADAFWVEPQSKSRQIVIEQIRELQGRIYLTSLLGSWRAAVIVAADRLNGPASNAFLKTLEEPPPDSLFLLLTDSPQYLLPTVASRCQRVMVGREASHLPEEALGTLRGILRDHAARRARGVSPVATSFAHGDRLARLFKELKKAAEELVKARAKESAIEEDEETIEARASSLYKQVRTGLMRAMLLWHRDILLLANGGDAGGVFHAGDLAVLRDEAKRIGPVQALRHVRLVEDMNAQMEQNLPESAVAGVGFGRLV